MPSPPTRPAASSVRMSPNMLVVTITSKLCGSRMRRMAIVSTMTSSTVTSGNSLATRWHSSTNMPQPSLKTVFLCTTVSRFLRCRAISRAARATRDEPAPGDDAHRNRHVLRRAELARARDHVAVRLKALVVLAHDDEVDVVVDGAQARIGPRRPDIGEQVEALAQDRVRIDRPRHLRVGPVADRPEDEAIHLPQRLDRALRQGRAVRVERRAADAASAASRSPARSRAAAARGHLDGGRHDLVADVVAVRGCRASDGCAMLCHRPSPRLARGARPRCATSSSVGELPAPWRSARAVASSPMTGTDWRANFVGRSPRRTAAAPGCRWRARHAASRRAAVVERDGDVDGVLVARRCRPPRSTLSRSATIAGSLHRLVGEGGGRAVAAQQRGRGGVVDAELALQPGARRLLAGQLEHQRMRHQLRPSAISADPARRARSRSSLAAVDRRVDDDAAGIGLVGVEAGLPHGSPSPSRISA